MSQLILLRHGESVWNAQKRFTGWVDVPLSEKGIREALEAGKEIKNISLDIVYCSSLIRSQMTAMLACKDQKVPILQSKNPKEFQNWGEIHEKEVKDSSLPVVIAWQLNERMYGKLQGLNKDKMREIHGDKQVQLWRRSFATRPPGGESLKQTAERVLPYFKQHILKDLKEGKQVLVSAHGNSLRAIIWHISGLSEKELLSLEVPTGKPLVYFYENNAFTLI